jgi:hypothetical protein
MSNRAEVTLTYRVQDRVVTIKAMETVAVEDCYDMLMKSVLHRYNTGEDATPPISREIKDALIKQNLTV